MPLELVTHTQTLIDSLWEINMATERASWIQTKQAPAHRYNNGNNSHNRSSGGTRYHIECAVVGLNLNPSAHAKSVREHGGKQLA